MNCLTPLANDTHFCNHGPQVKDLSSVVSLLLFNMNRLWYVSLIGFVKLTFLRLWYVSLYWFCQTYFSSLQPTAQSHSTSKYIWLCHRRFATGTAWLSAMVKSTFLRSPASILCCGSLGEPMKLSFGLFNL